MLADAPRTLSSWFRAGVVSALSALPLMGCSNHIFEKFDIDRGGSLSVDAKQRVVLVTHKGGKTGDRTIVCAEPSPDALTTLAAASAKADGAFSNTNGAAQTNASIALSVASSEAAASIAKRTQTIQLLRDGLYRACEAYMNGAIDQHQYNVILTNIDKLMITTLGLETITGTGTASGEGSALASAVQSEAAANIVLAASAHSSLPATCISLLASGELRLDNPGQKALLERCDLLLAGAVNALVEHPPQPPMQYKMTVPPQVTAAPHSQSSQTGDPLKSIATASQELDERAWSPVIERED